MTGPTVGFLHTAQVHVATFDALVATQQPGAWEAFEAGDTDGYERLVEAAARALAPTVDVVVLAQASMAGAADRLRDLGVPVLTSPGPDVRAALEAARP